MNDLEKLFKDGLSDFEEATPSKSLWWRISTSLFVQKQLGKTILLFALLSIVGIYSINQIYFKDSIQKTTTSKSVANEAVAMNQTATINTTAIENKDVQPENSVSKSNSLKEEIQIEKNQKQNSKTQNFTSNQGELSGAEVQISNTHQGELSGTEVQNTNSKQQTPNTEQIITKQQQVVVSTNLEVFISSLEYQKSKEWKNEGSAIPYSPALIPFNRLPTHHFQFIEVYAGPTFNQTNLSNSDFKEYINYRNNSETQKITPNFGVNYRYIFKNWFISGGGSYHQIRTDANYLLPINVVDSTINMYSIVRMNYSYQVIGTMIDPNNPTNVIPIYGTVTNPDTTHYSEVFKDTISVLENFKYSQKYTYVEIPVMLGREFRYKNFVFETAMGVSYSRLTKYETKLPDLTTQNLLSDMEVDNIIVQNSFNGIFGFGAAYQLTENKAVFIRPEFKYNLNSMFNKSFPIGQRNSQMRVVMGIRYEL